MTQHIHARLWRDFRHGLAFVLGLAWLVVCAVTLIDVGRDHAVMNGASMTSDVWIVLFTAALVVVAVTQVLVYWQMHTANKVIERAYITISHRPPGLNISEQRIRNAVGVETQELRITVKVHNSGNTPARVTRTVLHPYIVEAGDDLPDNPAYDEDYAQAGRVHLSKGASFEIQSRFDWPSSEIQQPAVGPPFRALCVIGYVDYIDKFGTRHRCGYAREYDRLVDVYYPHWKAGGLEEREWRKRNNLPYVTRSNYNYDRRRGKGEGDDWEDALE